MTTTAGPWEWGLDRGASESVAGPPELPRPTRAELRRARELSEPPTPSAAAAPAGRGETRAQRAHRRRRRRGGALGLLVSAWWFYVVLALLAVCAVLGVRSSDTPGPTPGVVVSTPTPVP